VTKTASTVGGGASAAGFKKRTKGVTPPSTPGRQGVFLTDVIVELGFASQEEVDEVVEAGRTSAKPVEKLLLENDTVDENQLALAIAERNGLDHVDLGRFDVDMSAAAMITRSVGQRYGAVPIAFASDGALILAVEDPFDSLAICDIEVMTRSVVRPAIATHTAIHELLERLPEESSEKQTAVSGGGGWNMPRIQAQPDLQVLDGEAPEAVENEVEEPEAEEPEVEEPEVEEPEVEEPEVEEPEVEEPEVEEPEAATEHVEEPEVGGKQFEQLGAVLAQRAVSDPEPVEAEPSPSEKPAATPATESPAVPGVDPDLERAGKRAQRLESELLVARRQISDLKRQIAESGPPSPELERRYAELEQRISELELQKAELEQQKAELEQQKAELEQRISELEEQNGGFEQQKAELGQRISELEEQNGEFEQQNARLELKVSDLEQRLAEVVSVAEEATGMTAKLDALRRVIERSRD
jgi:hypothetical protein